MTEAEPVDHVKVARSILRATQTEQPVDKAIALGIVATAHALVAIAERLPGGTSIVYNDKPPGTLDPEKVAERINEVLDERKRRRRDL
jgi:hypothetical protein